MYNPELVRVISTLIRQSKLHNDMKIQLLCSITKYQIDITDDINKLNEKIKQIEYKLEESLNKKNK